MIPKSKSKVRLRKRMARGNVLVEAQHRGPGGCGWSAGSSLIISNMAKISAVLETMLLDSCMKEKLPAGQVAAKWLWLPGAFGPSTSNKTGAKSELTSSASKETFSNLHGSGSRKTSAEAICTQAT